MAFDLDELNDARPRPRYPAVAAPNKGRTYG